MTNNNATLIILVACLTVTVARRGVVSVFKIELEGLFRHPGEQLTLDRTTEFSVTDERGASLIPGTVHIHGVIRNTAGVVYSDASLEADLHTFCDRCACPVKKHLNVPMVHTFVPSVENEDQDDYIVLPDLVLELDALAEEDLVLNLPSKVLCQEDCKGLCPTCGKNLNDGPCDCKEPVDPRLAGLLDLLN